VNDHFFNVTKIDYLVYSLVAYFFGPPCR